MGLQLALTKYIGPQQNSSVHPVAPKWLGPAVTLIFNTGLAYLCFLSGRWYLYFILWVYPILAVSIALNIIRTVAEHQPEDFPNFRDGQEIAMRPVARTTVPNMFEKWLLYQANFNYHIEHHLFPVVPRHNLRALHLHLVENGFYRQFPEALQKSGIAKFWKLSRNESCDDYTDAVRDAILH
jgi:fatty acid desaturase